MRKNRSEAAGWLSLDKLAELFIEVKADKKAAEIEYNSVKSTLITRLDGVSSVDTERYSINYSNHQREIMDVERLKVERPDIYKKYLKPSDCWTLNISTRASSSQVA